MAFYVYSAEPLPAPVRKSNRAFTRNAEFIQFQGFSVVLPEKTWVKLEPFYTRTYSNSDQELNRSLIRILDAEMAEFINAKFSTRGVKCLHGVEYDNQEIRLKTEQECADRNLKFRKFVVEEFERGRDEKRLTGSGRSFPTPYEEECYEILGLPKPYSVDAFRAERMPGEEAGRRIANEIVAALEENRLKQERAVEGNFKE